MKGEVVIKIIKFLKKLIFKIFKKWRKLYKNELFIINLKVMSEELE